MELPIAELQEELAWTLKEVARIKESYDHLLTKYTRLLVFMDLIRNQLALEIDA